MNKFKILFVTFLFIGFIKINAAEKAAIGQPAPGFELLSSEGQKYTLNQFKGKIVVLEWINFGCPFVKKHYNSKNMQSLQKKYADKEVVWLSICSSAEGKQGFMDQNKIKGKLTEIGYKGSAYLIDEDGQVGQMYAAKTTPHMFVINKEGILIYDGAIDSKATTKISDLDSAENYVIKTVDLLLAEKKIDPFKTKPYGCSVKYK